ncbi:hypothetical protein ACX4MT_06105 [Roseomonas mucosa]
MAFHAGRPGLSFGGVAFRGAPALLVALALAGCGSTDSKNPLANAMAPCPAVSLLGEAADLTRYRGLGRDIPSMVLDARLTGYQAKCDYAPGHKGLDVTLRLAMAAERGPAATTRTASLPYFVAVTTADEGRILAKANYTAAVEFPANVNRVQTSGEEISIRIPAATPGEAAQRQVLLGFQLSPEELALNRQRGPRR